jgi:hypothetical protein
VVYGLPDWASWCSGWERKRFHTAAKPASQRYSIAQLAKAYGIPYEAVDNPNQPNSPMPCSSDRLTVDLGCLPLHLKKNAGIPPLDVSTFIMRHCPI